MTANKRIVLNIAATYGRSLYSIAIGLFSARWVLEALGADNYGLYGVVGGLTVFIGFLNSMLACAVGRFYAYSVGAVRSADDKSVAVEDCRRWFNTALCIHTTIPIALMIVGYPLGSWAVRNWLQIDPARIGDAIWIFRFTCLTCFVGMVNVPFSAMYTAKQYIAELTVYSVAQTTFNFFFYYYMVLHPGEWLVKYALWGCFIAVAPQILICLRALKVFPECKIRLGYFWSVDRFRKLGSFAGWQMFSGVGTLLSNQGMQILINKFFGTTINASMSVANTVNGHAQSLSSALQGAFAPAITQACGARQIDLMKSLAFRSCKFALLLSLIFVVPLMAELDNVMTLWLKNPPQYVSQLCMCFVVSALIDKCSVGHMVALNANGKIALYQTMLGTVRILTLPIAWFFVVSGSGACSVAYAYILTSIVCSLGRVWLAKRLVDMNVMYWVWRVVAPVLLLTVVSLGVSMLPSMVFDATFSRVLLTGMISELVIIPLAWFVVLDGAERIFVSAKVRALLSKWR